MGPPGHFGVAFAARPFAPKAPLWILLVASEALDILSFGFITIGLEKMAVSKIDFQHGVQTILPGSVPWSHGLLMSVVWSALFAAITCLVFKNWKTSMMIGLVTFSHWILDFIVHSPDLPLLLHNSPEFGLGLWASGPGFILSMILEFALLTGGIVIYIKWRKREKLTAVTSDQLSVISNQPIKGKIE